MQYNKVHLEHRTNFLTVHAIFYVNKNSLFLYK